MRSDAAAAAAAAAEEEEEEDAGWAGTSADCAVVRGEAVRGAGAGSCGGEVARGSQGLALGPGDRWLKPFEEEGEEATGARGGGEVSTGGGGTAASVASTDTAEAWGGATGGSAAASLAAATAAAPAAAAAAAAALTASLSRCARSRSRARSSSKSARIKLVWRACMAWLRAARRSTAPASTGCPATRAASAQALYSEENTALLLPRVCAREDEVAASAALGGREACKACSSLSVAATCVHSPSEAARSHTESNALESEDVGCQSGLSKLHTDKQSPTSFASSMLALLQLQQRYRRTLAFAQHWVAVVPRVSQICASAHWQWKKSPQSRWIQVLFKLAHCQWQ
jgi:hypothetical protein